MAVEPVYGTCIQLVRLIFRVQGLKITVSGAENLLASGGAVIAINHTGYLDFTFAGLPTYQQGLGRKVRFMAKQEVFDSKITGPIMRSLRHIPVDRQDGAASYEVRGSEFERRRAGRRLPRSDHQPQLRDQGIQSGRRPDGDRGRGADHPAHRLGCAADLDQGPPKKLWRPKVPITVLVGEPIEPTLAMAELNDLLHSRMQHLLERAQEQYGPHPAGEFWVPHRLGGGAPTLAEAARLDAEEAAVRAAHREQAAGAPEQ